MPRTWRRSKRLRDLTDTGTRIPPLLPVSSSHSGLSNAMSCWYCDYKITSFNETLFHFGRRHARILRSWFSIGIGFCLAVLVVVTTVLFLELATALHLFGNSNVLHDLPLSSSSLFGFPSLFSRSSFIPADAGYIIFSTLISVAFHEFGHAVAAASESMKVEYIAVFIALIFPGALVAFNHDLLHSSCFTALRIYCAGIWHNAVLSAACGLILFFLPLILFPFYIHGESPMVLDVPPTSPLFGYLSHGHVIVSLDGMHIRSVEDWINLSAQMSDLPFQNGTLSKLGDNKKMASDRKKGYCVPNVIIRESNKVRFTYDQSTCSDGLTSFTTIPCVTALIDRYLEDGHPNQRDRIHCLNVSDVIKLNRCTNGLDKAMVNGSTCLCSQDETCLSPVQVPSLVWVEITYLNSQSSECLHSGEYLLPNSNCSGTFIFVGDLISMASSIQLTMYQPRWDFHFATYLPHVLERILLCLFHVSLALALLNSLPVYYLDGESIVEIILFHFTSMSPRNRGKILQSFLMAGTLISVLFLLKVFFHLFIS